MEAMVTAIMIGQMLACKQNDLELAYAIARFDSSALDQAVADELESIAEIAVYGVSGLFN